VQLIRCVVGRDVKDEDELRCTTCMRIEHVSYIIRFTSPVKANKEKDMYIPLLRQLGEVMLKTMEVLSLRYMP
jgi:hypothetical protein